MGIKVGDSIFTDIDYADDAVVLFTDDDVAWPSVLSEFDLAASTMGLHTSWAKTNVQNTASGPPPTTCTISGHQVEVVTKFTYLGSDIDSSGYCALEIHRRLGLASSVMSQLDRVWKHAKSSFQLHEVPYLQFLCPVGTYYYNMVLKHGQC